MLLGSALLIHLVTAAACYALARGVGAQLSVLDAGILIPPVVLLMAAPISISGWGVREGAKAAEESPNYGLARAEEVSSHP
ncbi:lysylphosphatidylglycerol synthase domain-containing protein [Bradyrhizobium sp. CCBAU 11386]|uniref:lysylphosphatidylglycerol synthase domain-containing protein n=1 Tax=Bradyrhizobium sp. CCBAU 11386 TaxID=1630837 RepID=UPI002302EB9E|nr:lysylphosphatidylglycerol synthase domain-containing protein [Bradyrhizobium sp. CCBAU 11386]